MSAGTSTVLPNNTFASRYDGLWLPSYASGGGGVPGVTQIVAGTGIVLSPLSGEGVVTVSTYGTIPPGNAEVTGNLLVGGTLNVEGAETTMVGATCVSLTTDYLLTVKNLNQLSFFLCGAGETSTSIAGSKFVGALPGNSKVTINFLSYTWNYGPINYQFPYLMYYNNLTSGTNTGLVMTNGAVVGTGTGPYYVAVENTTASTIVFGVLVL